MKAPPTREASIDRIYALATDVDRLMKSHNFSPAESIALGLCVVLRVSRAQGLSKQVVMVLLGAMFDRGDVR